MDSWIMLDMTAKSKYRYDVCVCVLHEYMEGQAETDGRTHRRTDG